MKTTTSSKIRIAIACLLATITACVAEPGADDTEDVGSPDQVEITDTDTHGEISRDRMPVEIPVELQTTERISCSTFSSWVNCGKGTLDCHLEICTVCCSGFVCEVSSCHRV